MGETKKSSKKSSPALPEPELGGGYTKKDLETAVKEAVQSAQQGHRKAVEEHGRAAKELRSKLADAENRVKLTSERAEALTGENRKLQDSVQPLKTQVSAHAKNLIESEKKVQQLKRDLDAAFRERDAADRRFTGLENTTEQMQVARDSALAQHREAEELRHKAEQERDAARKDVEGLRGRVSDLEKTLREAKIQVTKEAPAAQ